MIASLLGGGAMGAVISSLISKHRNRRQPIGYTIEIIEIFKKTPELPSLHGLLMLSEQDEHKSGGAVSVNCLSVARVTLKNKGNQDVEEFNFGITLESNAIDVKFETPDRHHIVNVLTPVSLVDLRKEIDFSLRPFNRRDKYILNVYFMYTEKPGTVKLSSAHATEFIEMDSSNQSVGNIDRWELALLRAGVFLLLVLSMMVILGDFLKDIFVKLLGK